MYSWFDAKTLIYNKIDNFSVELNRFSYSSDYVPKGLANKLKKELCISMQDWDFILEEYIDLPFELDEAVKKNLQRFIHAQDSGGYYGTE